MSGNHQHSHAIPQIGNEHRLWWALGLTTTFLIVEVIGGLLTNSLALLSDAAHMFTDTAALAIALAAIYVAKRPADKKRTFGYHRFEILAAAFNALLLFVVAFYILYEAWLRLGQPPELQTKGMLIIASAGLIINLISMKLLLGGKDDSLNVKGAYLEVWSDLLGSIGVVVGAVVIMFTGWTWVDSLVAVGIGFWVLPRTWILMRDSLNILLEGVPAEIDIVAVEKTLQTVDGVESIHDLHVWALTSGKISLTAHLVCPTGDVQAILNQAKARLAEEHNLEHVTLQCETESCEMDHPDAHLFQTPSHEGHQH